MIPALILFQAVVFAGWTVASGLILWSVLWRVLRGPAPLGDGLQIDAVSAFLRDPGTARLRRIWLVLTVLLFIGSAAAAVSVAGA